MEDIIQSLLCWDGRRQEAGPPRLLPEVADSRSRGRRAWMSQGPLMPRGEETLHASWSPVGASKEGGCDLGPWARSGTAEGQLLRTRTSE